MPRLHWSLRPSRHPPAWPAVQIACLERALDAARGLAPVEAWEVAATLLREHCTMLAPQYQAALMEDLARASASVGFTTRARSRPGRGPGPQLQLKRLLPTLPHMQPFRVQVGGAGGGHEATRAAGRGTIPVLGFTLVSAWPNPSAASLTPLIPLMRWASGMQA